VLGALLVGGGLIATAAALLDRPSTEAFGWAAMLFAIGLGFAIAAVRTPRSKGPVVVVALGGLVGGAIAGCVAAVMVYATSPARSGFGVLSYPVTMSLAALLCAPLLALPFAPVLVAATRAIRAPSHDGPSLVLIVAGAWGAIVGVAASAYGGRLPALGVTLAGALVCVAGTLARARIARSLASIRAGEAPGLAIVRGEEAGSLDGLDRVLPLFRGEARAGAPAWIVRAAASADYRASPSRVPLARIDADAPDPPSLLLAAFAGATAGGQVIGLILWGGGVLAIGYFIVVLSLR
jgi:hypothetical protein